MRFDDIYVAGVAGWLPPREPVGPDRYKPGVLELQEYESACVAGTGETAPGMAIRAGRLALTRSGTDPAEVSLLLHAHSWYQGHDSWTAAAYIHRALLGENRNAQAIDLNQQCAGMVSALQLAAEHLVADPHRRAAIVTSADWFAPPGIDRWHAEGAHLILGDGAGAAVLARGRGVARLLAARTVVDTALEPMGRGDNVFMPFSPVAQEALDMRTRRIAGVLQIGPEEVDARLARGLTDAVQGVLDEAGLTIADVSRFVFPNVGLGLLAEYLEPFGIDVAQTVWELGRTTGHVGAADPVTGLAYLLETRQLSVGDRVLLVGIGAGFFWACALVECTRIPDWTPAT